MSIMMRTGCYTEVLQPDWPPIPDWEKTARALGEQWRKLLSTQTDEIVGLSPKELAKWWKIIVELRGLKLDSLADNEAENKALRQALLQIAAVADEACFDVGFPLTPTSENNISDQFHQDCLDRLHLESTLCKTIGSDRVRVLPKMRTPQNGLTIRNLSHYLAFYPASEVSPVWNLIQGVNAAKPDHATYNLLLIPWPEHISPIEFSELKGDGQTNPQQIARCFSYQPNSQDADVVADHTLALLKGARETIGSVDGIVFPEASLSQSEFEKIVQLIEKSDPSDVPFLVAGISDADDGSKLSCNYLNCYFPGTQSENGLTEGVEVKIKQSKHHRWYLDRRQIIRYGLAAQLDPQSMWSEGIPIENRELNFISLSPKLLLNVLICEDLARPDPIGDLVRAVGPNLVIALLMDGPQLANRWSAQYAGVLADDPGASVLTLTSLGMINMSREWNQAQSPRKIALWRDSQSGLKELELPPDAQALVITILAEDSTKNPEWTSDGRRDNGNGFRLTLGGICPVRLP
jgi:hypothetical protein